jgi:UDP-N-acetylmuramate dehydrogenase
MKIKQNYPLKPHTSFKVGGPAEYFILIKNDQQLIEALNFAEQKCLDLHILGTASNVIIPDDGLKGLTIKFDNTNIQTTEQGNNVFIKVGAGTIWDNFVAYCVKNNYYGTENLSLIPGSVGASAVQNIGAYGQEVMQLICKVHAYDLLEKQFVEIKNEDCKFEYRKSIFNSIEKERYIITDITFKLTKQGEFNLNYPDMSYFKHDSQLTLQKVRNEIIKIRQNKLPDVNELPNTGSFFKHLIINGDEAPALIEKATKINPELSAKIKLFKTNDGKVKIATGILIDLCGLKGYQKGNMAVYEKHALTLVNKTGQATATEVRQFSDFIIEIVHKKLGVKISPEPTFL